MPKLFDHAFAYLFQTPDGRVVFAIPYEQDFTLIGTTEREYQGDPTHVCIDPDEVDYLLQIVNRYFERDLTTRGRHLDVCRLAAVARRECGRPDQHSARLRARFRSQRPAIVVGVRRQAHDLSPARRGRAGSTRAGARVERAAVDRDRAAAGRRHARRGFRTFSPATPRAATRGSIRRCCSVIRARTARASIDCWMAARRWPTSGEAVLPGLHVREIEYLRREEFAVTAEDILFRRSKLGVHLPAGSAARLDCVACGQAMTRFVLALDQGTTSSRSILFDHAGAPCAIAQREFTQHFPQSGWVEHDAEEIWATQAATIAEVLARARATPADIVAIGITNQRETTVCGIARPGGRLHRPSSGRTDAPPTCARAAGRSGLEPEVTQRTGLLLDPYFSGTKLALVARPRRRRQRRARSAASSRSARSTAGSSGS